MNLGDITAHCIVQPEVVQYQARQVPDRRPREGTVTVAFQLFHIVARNLDIPVRNIANKAFFFGHVIQGRYESGGHGSTGAFQLVIRTGAVVKPNQDALRCCTVLGGNDLRNRMIGALHVQRALIKEFDYLEAVDITIRTDPGSYNATFCTLRLNNLDGGDGIFHVETKERETVFLSNLRDLNLLVSQMEADPRHDGTRCSVHRR